MSTMAAQVNTKRKRSQRTPETLEAALARILALKLNEKERGKVEGVFAALRSGEITRDDEAKKMTKTETLALADVLAGMRRESRLRELVETKPENYRIITDDETFDEFISDLYAESITAWDTETTGLDLFCDRIVGYSVWLPRAGYGVYIPFAHTTGEVQLPEQVALESIRDYLEDPARQTIWHNAKFDMHMLRNHDINVADPYFDTQVAANVLNENESHRLKDLAPKYLRVKADHFASLFGDDPTIFDKPIGPAGVYAIKDVEFTWRLYEFQRPHIDSREGLKRVFWDIEMPQVRVSLEMERQGFALDLEGCKALEAELQPMVDEALAKVHEAYRTNTPEFLAKMRETMGRKSEIEFFNIASPQQLQYLVYDFLGLPDISKQVNPKLKPRSTSHDVLEALLEYDARLEPLLDYREKETLLKSFIRRFPHVLGPDGRLHYSLSQFGTETGRYSSSTYGAKGCVTLPTGKKTKLGCNIQNIPARSKVAKRVRKLLVADPGHLILTSDLSQIEPRILAHISGDKRLQSPYIEGDDIYIRMAMDLYFFERLYCEDGAYDPTNTFQPRKRSKTGLLAAMYGTSKWTLAQQMKITTEAAEDFLNTFFERYSDVKSEIDWTQESVQTVKYVETMFGRKRRFPDIADMMKDRKQLERIPWKKMTDVQRERLRELRKFSNGMLRASFNARIQGSAADVMKLILVEMYRLCQRKGWRMIATVHDQVDILVPETITPGEVEEVECIMAQTVKLDVPMKSDSTLGRTWGDEIPWRDWFAQHTDKATAPRENSNASTNAGCTAQSGQYAA